MGYFKDLKIKKRLEEMKANEEVLNKPTQGKKIGVGTKVKHEDKLGVIKFCGKDKCVVEFKDGTQVFIPTEELINQQTDRPLSEITEDLDTVQEGEETPESPTYGNESAIAVLLNTLLKDEIEATDGYNSAIATIQSLNTHDFDNIIAVLQDINAEENLHIGQLNRAMQIVNPQAKLINSGEEEAEEIIQQHQED